MYLITPSRMIGTRTAKSQRFVVGPRTMSPTAGFRVCTTRATLLSSDGMKGRGSPAARVRFITCCPVGSARLMVRQSGCVESTLAAIERKPESSGASRAGETASASTVEMELFRSISTVLSTASVRSSAALRKVSRWLSINSAPTTTANTAIGNSVASANSMR
jgi:hypothetical protein